MSSKILVAFPAYNEGKYIAALVQKANEYACEVIVLNDGSADDTVAQATSVGATVVSHLENKGKGVAIQSIFDEARKRIFDVLVVLDADSQHNPDDIPQIARPITLGYDVVIGNRVRNQVPLYRFIGQKILTLLTGVLSGETVDSQSGFRAYSAKAVLALHPKEKGFATESETISLATKMGLRITQVPISIKYFDDGSTRNPVAHGVDMVAKIIRMISERRPLLFFGLGGFIIMFCGVVLGVKSFIMLQEHAGILPIGTAMVALLLMVIGIQSMFSGIMMNVIKKIKE